ncbi:MAG: hypothetical protein L0287_10020 [Anaerolineae bacterium]|nr:hypothetical protein [Anaerolineae bacterium]
MKFSRLLETRYLEWRGRQKEGEKTTETEFAQWLGFSISTVSTWWNGKSEPNDEKIIRRLAQKLGDEVYDSLGRERPDFRLVFINEHWDEAGEERQKAAYEQVRKGTEKNDAKRVHSQRKKTVNQ